MGLVAQNHKHILNEELERKIIETFSLRILNEFDQEHAHKAIETKQHPFMATRYLQLQHADKKGRTSGDGRSIWNGSVQHLGQQWDVSSRGTGVTCLAPGAVQAKKALKTGSEEFGYGCGLAEIDEMLSSALLSEVFYRNEIPTERTLAVIDLGHGYGIGVRAAPNLIRPAHIFLYLKQNDHANLQKIFSLYCARRLKNKTMNSAQASEPKKALRLIAQEFAHFAALLEKEYIFAWLDWDGDNVLAEAGIIDYGSIRKMGCRHDQYRYDDIQRYSTNLNEQRSKARLTVQVFAQTVDFITSGKRKPLKNFEGHWSLTHFDKSFENKMAQLWAVQIFEDDTIAHQVLSRNPKLFGQLRKHLQALEKAKASHTKINVPDGINQLPLYCVPRLIAQLKRQLIEGKPSLEKLHFGALNEELKRRKSRKLTSSNRAHLAKSLTLIQKLLELVEVEHPHFEFKNLTASTHLTGNSVVLVIDKLLGQIKSKKNFDTQAAIEFFVRSYSQPKTTDFLVSIPKELESFFTECSEIVNQYRDGI